MSEVWPNYQPQRDYYRLGVQEVVTVTSVHKQGESGAYFTIATAPRLNGQSLEDVYRNAYVPALDTFRDVQENPVTVDGKTGFEIMYRRPWGEPWWQFRDIWVEADDMIIVLSFHALPGSFSGYQEDFEEIINGFAFK